MPACNRKLMRETSSLFGTFSGFEEDIVPVLFIYILYGEI